MVRAKRCADAASQPALRAREERIRDRRGSLLQLSRGWAFLLHRRDAQEGRGAARPLARVRAEADDPRRPVQRGRVKREKKAQISSLAERSCVVRPRRRSRSRALPGQVWPPPITLQKTTGA